MSAASHQPAVQSASTAPSPINELPDELLVACAAFLDFPRDLLNFGQSHKRANALPTDHLWREFCVRRWAAWPRYAHASARGGARRAISWSKLAEQVSALRGRRRAHDDHRRGD